MLTSGRKNRKPQTPQRIQEAKCKMQSVDRGAENSRVSHMHADVRDGMDQEIT